MTPPEIENPWLNRRATRGAGRTGLVASAPYERDDAAMDVSGRNHQAGTLPNARKQVNGFLSVVRQASSG